MKRARYTRVSTAKQNLERQLTKTHPDEKLFIDIISGSIPFKDRPNGMLLISKAIKGEIDYITVKSADRLGRNLFDILSTLEVLNKHKVTLKIENLGLESFIKNKPNQVFKLIISVLGNIAEMERETLLERQREGIAIAKLKGKYTGRIRGTKMSDEEFLKKYKGVVKLLKQNYSVRKTAKLEEVSPGTVMKVKKLMN